jgi:hypothetical protein
MVCFWDDVVFSASTEMMAQHCNFDEELGGAEYALRERKWEYE